MAYVAREPGRGKVEVYVRPFPGSGGRWQVSSDGGDNPAWSLTRRELIYATPDQRIMAVPYSVNRDSFHAEKPRLLPNSRFVQRAASVAALICIQTATGLRWSRRPKHPPTITSS